MAQVTIEIPSELRRIPDALTRAVVTGVRIASEEAVTAVKTSPEMPSDRGLLRGGITAVPVHVANGRVSGGVAASGQSAKYADVQETGRRAGARNPPFAAILAWVKRTSPGKVTQVARVMQAQYNASHPRRRKGVSRSLAKFERQAAFLLARGVIRKLKRAGMPGKQFAEGQREFAERQLVARVQHEIDELAARFNNGGAV